MKKSELSFKCVIESLEIESNLKRLLGLNGEKTDGNCFARYYDGYLETVASAKAFSVWPEPIMNSRDAIKLIESIEPDAPKFDINFSEKCLGKNNIEDSWKVVSFGAIGNQAFRTLENGSVNIVTPLTRDTFLNTSNVAGWWECESGKPVWRTK